MKTCIKTASNDEQSNVLVHLQNHLTTMTSGAVWWWYDVQEKGMIPLMTTELGDLRAEIRSDGEEGIVLELTMYSPVPVCRHEAAKAALRTINDLHLAWGYFELNTSNRRIRYRLPLSELSPEPDVNDLRHALSLALDTMIEHIGKRHLLQPRQPAWLAPRFPQQLAANF